MKNDKIIVNGDFKGHLWEKKSTATTNWTDSYGTMFCKRCLSVITYEQENADSEILFLTMKNIFNKKVPKRIWGICNASTSQTSSNAPKEGE